MKNVFKLLILTVISLGLNGAQAKSVFNFGNVSLNYLDWTDKAEERSATSGMKKDFSYLELEGGSVFDWGSVYGFFDLENIAKGEDNSDGKGFRTAAKGSISVNLGKTSWNLYTHVYALSAHDFEEQSRVLGVSYDFEGGESGWFSPFVGFHHVTTTVETPQWAVDQKIRFEGFSGSNGMMVGWAGTYKFTYLKQNWSLFSWHETELLRARGYGEEGVHKKDIGHNGALSMWWHSPSAGQAVGLQYRYADHKLGTPAYQDAVIVTVRQRL